MNVYRVRVGGRDHTVTATKRYTHAVALHWRTHFWSIAGWATSQDKADRLAKSFTPGVGRWVDIVEVRVVPVTIVRGDR